MDKSATGKAASRYAALDISRLLRNPTPHYCIYRTPQLGCLFLSWLKSVIKFYAAESFLRS